MMTVELDNINLRRITAFPKGNQPGLISIENQGSVMLHTQCKNESIFLRAEAQNFHQQNK